MEQKSAAVCVSDLVRPWHANVNAEYTQRTKELSLSVRYSWREGMIKSVNRRITTGNGYECICLGNTQLKEEATVLSTYSQKLPLTGCLICFTNQGSFVVPTEDTVTSDHCVQSATVSTYLLRKDTFGSSDLRRMAEKLVNNELERSYACETWVLKESSIQNLMIFERKILRKIFGPTKEVNGLWRIKTNEELDVLIKRKNIIRFIKAQRLKWLGHVERMPNEREVTRIYKWKPLASRPKGRPKNRWEDDVRMDLQKMKIKNWKKSVLDRNSWRTIVERTKTRTELQRL